MKPSVLMNEMKKLQGTFYVKNGQYTWDVLWGLELDAECILVRVNLASRYRRSSCLRGRLEHEAPPGVVAVIDHLRTTVADWISNDRATFTFTPETLPGVFLTGGAK